MGDVYRAFTGSIPQNYDRYLVPLIFEPYAKDLAARLACDGDARLLELACGTGILTAQLATGLGAGGRLTASDLNQAMLDVARGKLGGDARIAWQQIDATILPFEDATFDAIVCQFGVMFFPDKPRALREARRVLRPDGRLLFSTWDRLEHCCVFAEAEAEIRACFPADPPHFYDVPFGMHDRSAVVGLAHDAGFTDVDVAVVELSGERLSARDIATGIVRGGPFVTEIEQRGGDVEAVVGRVAKRLQERFGAQPFAAPMSALVTSAA